MLRALSLAIGLYAGAGLTGAQTLPDLWTRLATSEPTLLAAKAQAQAIAERENQTFAQFLPQVNVTANTIHNHRQYQQLGALPSTSNDWYNSNGAQLNLTQTLWKPGNNIAHTQAYAASEQARQQLLATQQDLLGKLVSAWAEAHYARDALQAAQALEAAASQQMNSYERGFSLGLYAVNQRDDAKAKLQQAVADRYAAESELFARHAALEQLVGPLPPRNTLHAEPMVLEPQKIPFGGLQALSFYTARIDEANPAIRAAQQALQVAQEEVRKQQAQYSPSLDLQASVGRSAQPAVGTTFGQPGFKSRQDTIGLQLNWPLYSGGAQSSKVREAVALASKAQFELDSAQRNARSQASQAWAQLRSAQAKLEAAEQGLVAALSAERVAVQGQKSGTKTPLDELQARQQAQLARRDARRAYYDNIIGMAKLLTATGAIEEATLQDIQRRQKTPAALTPLPGIDSLVTMEPALPRHSLLQ
jgi:outer membrane protein